MAAAVLYEDTYDAFIIRHIISTLPSSTQLHGYKVLAAGVDFIPSIFSGTGDVI